MAPNKRVVAAYRAMSSLGIAEAKVKSVLKKLLKLYDKNWDLIEEENYRVLADAIFDFEDDDNEVPELKKKTQTIDFSNNQEEEAEGEEGQGHADQARPLKRLRLRGQESQTMNPPTSSAPSSDASPSKKPRLEDDASPKGHSGKGPQNKAVSSDGNVRVEAPLSLPRDSVVNKGKKPASPHVSRRGGGVNLERAYSSQPTIKPGNFPPPKNQVPCNNMLIIPKDEPIDELPDYEAPIAVIPPEPSSVRDASMNNDVAGKHGGRVTVTSSQCRDGVRDGDDFPSSNEETSYNLEIASSPLGEVKLSLSCSPAFWGPEFRMPSRDQLLERMEDKYLRSHKISDPNFSVLKLLRDLCDCMLEFRSDSISDSQECSKIRASVDALEASEALGAHSVGVNEDLDVFSRPPNGSTDGKAFAALVPPLSPSSLTCPIGPQLAIPISKIDKTDDFSQSNSIKELGDPMFPNSDSLEIVPHSKFTADDLRSIHYVNDLTKGEESVQIPWANDSTSDFPPSFYYIPQNIVFQDAHVNISLSRIGCEDCCSTCLGNCVLSSSHCACANKTGGGFAYTSQGLLKEEFLEQCVSVSHNPQQHFFYCEDCPLERHRNDGCIEPCKGHLKRKFIKECWSKCGCGKQCGNRVIQRGITCKLEVFFTSEGKGWGLRTLEDLPKGAFVCEFVGEILTIKELHERNLKCAENGKYTYPILLDANWDSGFVNDEKALCLDAASFGNTARFINHRCSDANLVEIPVEVEDPDQYYYHFALFSSREITAQEELTWDYGIDFDDQDHPGKLFQCRCGSKFCRNMKRSNRSIRSA